MLERFSKLQACCECSTIFACPVVPLVKIILIGMEPNDSNDWKMKERQTSAFLDLFLYLCSCNLKLKPNYTRIVVTKPYRECIVIWSNIISRSHVNSQKLTLTWCSLEACWNSSSKDSQPTLREQKETYSSQPGSLDHDLNEGILTEQKQMTWK